LLCAGDDPGTRRGSGAERIVADSRSYPAIEASRSFTRGRVIMGLLLRAAAIIVQAIITVLTTQSPAN
jgi:hypothetical protein